MNQAIEAHDNRQCERCGMDGEVVPRLGPLIGANGIAAYMALCFYDSVRGRTRPTTTDIGGIVGLSESDTRDALAKLVTWGLISTQLAELPNGSVETDYVILSKSEWRDAKTS